MHAFSALSKVSYCFKWIFKPFEPLTASALIMGNLLSWFSSLQSSRRLPPPLHKRLHKAFGYEERKQHREVQHLKILNSDNLNAPTAKQSNTWEGKKKRRKYVPYTVSYFKIFWLLTSVLKREPHLMFSHLCSLNINVHNLTTTCWIMGH